jgi:mannan endo-1,4-beta-mannosidase
MDEAADLGLNSLRLFASPPPMYGPLWKVDSSGEVTLNENAARALDFIIAEAGERGLRVLLSLENYWNVRKNTRARAGITAMVHAASKDPEGPGGDYEREDFYTDPVARRIYRDYVQELLTRTNTVTGVTYRDDPTIFAWELLNEPRCEYCPDSDIADWVNEMAAYVKSLDPNHLVTPGVEGFYSAESSPDMLYVNPSYTSGKDWSHITGQDFNLLHKSDDIDFTTIHIWPDNWERTDPEFQEQWIRVHAADSEKLGKPMLVSEFGKDLEEGTLRDRENVLSAAYETIEEDMKLGGAIAGSMFWNLYFDPLRDGYGVSLSDSNHGDTLDIIEEHADFAPTSAGLDAGGAGGGAPPEDAADNFAAFLELDGQNRG